MDCNIEILLENQELPFQGPESMQFRNFAKFDDLYMVVEEIERKIILDEAAK
jgi:hypothetical protein